MAGIALINIKHFIIKVINRGEKVWNKKE